MRGRLKPAKVDFPIAAANLLDLQALEP